MPTSNKIFKLNGVIQHYAWGGNTYIPSLLGFENTSNKPFAEYWMGAHPFASAILETSDGPISLIDIINKDPETVLTKAVFDRFGELPYLLKVLDVKQM